MALERCARDGNKMLDLGPACKQVHARAKEVSHGGAWIRPVGQNRPACVHGMEFWTRLGEVPDALAVAKQIMREVRYLAAQVGGISPGMHPFERIANDRIQAVVPADDWAIRRRVACGSFQLGQIAFGKMQSSLGARLELPGQ